MANNLSKGQKGEEIALKYLVEKGYQLVAQNYRYKKGEIDLVVQKSDLLVFVEVKWRSSDAFGFPEEAVGQKKAQLIVATADQYIFENDWQGNIRFDIVAILQKNEQISITHFEDAFY